MQLFPMLQSRHLDLLILKPLFSSLNNFHLRHVPPQFHSILLIKALRQLVLSTLVLLILKNSLLRLTILIALTQTALTLALTTSDPLGFPNLQALLAHSLILHSDLLTLLLDPEAYL